MKGMGVMFIALAALMTAALAAGQDPVERGKELFNSTHLGTNGKSCATCHPSGSKLEEAASYDEKDLEKIVNQCIKKALAGKPLPAESADMKAIITYMRTFASP
jgi:cytochrome c